MKFLQFVCAMILGVINSIYEGQIYDFFFEDKIIYSCKYEKNVYARQTACDVAANKTKQRYEKLQRDLLIYGYDDSKYSDTIEKMKNTGNDILRYRNNSCNPYSIDSINKKESFYIKNLIYCRELYNDYNRFCKSTITYSYCEKIYYNWEKLHKLYIYK